MEKTRQAVKGIIQLGDIDGVVITHDIDSEKYHVRMPNKYDLTHTFSKYERVGFAPNPNALDKGNDVIYATPSIFDMDEKAQKQFMFDVGRTRNANKEITTEREIFTTALDFDLSPQKPVYIGIPLHAKRDENNAVIKNASGSVVKTPGYVKGEIVAVGKYLVAIKSERNETQDQATIHMIETSKFLKFEDYKEHDRFQQVIKRLGLDPVNDFNGDEIKRGINKYISFNENGLVKTINNTYTKELKQEQAPEIKEEVKIEQQQIKQKTKQHTIKR